MRKRSKRTVRRIVEPTIVAYHLNPEVSMQERRHVRWKLQEAIASVKGGA